MQTGYFRDPDSERDFIYGAIKAPVTDLPKRLNYESLFGPALDQGNTTQCVTYAVAGLKRFHEWKQSRKWLEFDAADLYSACKSEDGIPNAGGTLPRVAMDILRKRGIRGSDGRFYKIEAAARQTSVNGIRQALAHEGPVLIGIRIDPAAFMGLTDQPLGAVAIAHAAGHCMLVVGYDDDLQAFRVRNSWGETWGDTGHFWLKYDYLVSIDPNFDAWSSIDDCTPDAGAGALQCR